MRLYRIEFGKILKRKSTGLFLLFLFVFIAVMGGTEISNRESMITNFGQIAGYRRFFDLAELFLTGAFLVETAALASLFCEDRQYHVDDLLFTTKKGGWYDYVVREFAILTFIFFLNALMLMAAYLICGGNYGYAGGNLLVQEMTYVSGTVYDEKSILELLGLYFWNVFFASVALSSMIVCISALSKNSVHAVIAAAVLLFLPVLLEGVFRSGEMNFGYTVVTSAPIMLVVRRCLVESGEVYGWHIVIVGLVSAVFCLAGGKMWCYAVEK